MNTNPLSDKKTPEVFFSIENSKRVLKFLYARSGIHNPWKNYRGLVGSIPEKEWQLIKIIEKHTSEMDRVYAEYSSLLKDHFIEGIAVDELAKQRNRASQSIYRDMDRAVQILCEYMNEFEPPFWHQIPPSLDTSPVLASVLYKYTEEAYKLLSKGKSPVGIVGRQGTRRSFIAAETARLLGDSHLVDACFWVRAPKSINECREIVESQREKFIKDEHYLRMMDYLKTKMGNNRILVVFDDITDSQQQSNFIKEYIRSFPKFWFGMIVGFPDLQIPHKVTVRPLQPEQTEGYVYESCREKGIDEHEISAEILKEIVAKSEGWVSEVENIISAAARINGEGRLEKALGESWFSLISRNSSPDNETNPDMVLLQVISLLPGGITEEDLHKITGFPRVYVRERLNMLLSSALTSDESWYFLRPSRRPYFEGWHPGIRPQLLNTYAFYAATKFKVPQGKFLEIQSKNFYSLIQKLLSYGRPREAVQLIVKDGRWFVERIFERDGREALSLLDIVASAAEQVGSAEDEMIVKTLRGYFILRLTGVSDEIVQESYAIEKRALDLMENCNDPVVTKKLLRSLLGARANVGDHFRHQKKLRKGS